ncbi:pilus assembly protein [Peribacillus alkalitolerans]|uniref:pilus assembly protein n=1 Tax=Peribacillus alkalitolerans TaxID=1550385 RepID=UPI0013D5340C|nr:pilus assembly protein [Peribacillus alkalitolerans]
MRKAFKNEEGSVSLEFLGILPFYFMFFLLLWQVVASGYAVLSAKTALNDAAKTFASTNDTVEAELIAKEAIGSSSVISYEGLRVTPGADGRFTMTLESEHFLIFVPPQWKDKTSVSLSMDAVGRVLVQ